MQPCLLVAEKELWQQPGSMRTVFFEKTQCSKKCACPYQMAANL